MVPIERGGGHPRVSDKSADVYIEEAALYIMTESDIVSYTKTGRPLTIDEAEKRRRNNAASARFRAKKKALEQNLQRNIREQSYRSQFLETKVKELEHCIMSITQYAQSKGIEVPSHYMPSMMTSGSPALSQPVQGSPMALSIPQSPAMGSLPSPLSNDLALMTGLPHSPELGSPPVSTPSTPSLHMLPPFLPPFKDEETDPSNFRF